MKIDYCKAHKLYQDSKTNLMYYSPLGLLYCGVDNLINVENNVILLSECSVEGVFILNKEGVNTLKKEKERLKIDFDYLDYKSSLLFDDAVKTSYSNDEAIYNIGRFSKFEGLSNKKRLCKTFEKKYLENDIVFSVSDKLDCKMFKRIEVLYNNWMINSEHADDYELKIIEKLLYINDFPKIQIYLIEYRGLLVGYCFSEIGNHNIALIHFIKCCIDMTGLYQYFHRKIANYLIEKFNVKFINYGNLSCIDGLRTMKLQLKPERFESTYSTMEIL